MMCLITTALLISLLKYASSANILYVAPVASPSHHIWNRALAWALIEKGHYITMLGHDAEKGEMPKNFTSILIEGIYQEAAALDLNVLLKQTPLTGVIQMYEWATICCDHDLKSDGLQTLLDYPEDYKFDLIIYDVTLGQCLYPLIERFHDPPVVAVTPFLLPPVLSNSFGNHLYTSYMPFYTSEFTNQMTFPQRILNFMYIHWDLIYRNYVFLPTQEVATQNRFGKNIRPLKETERRFSLLLSNIDPVLDYPVALPPNIVPVGGLQVKPARKLPSDLKRIIDEAKDGVVLFSLGTNVRSDKLDLNTRKAFLDAFAKISQVVLWKCEDENLKGLPKNVVVRKWLPQNDILGHPNTKLFISHGGALSIHEAMYHGVPVLGVPFFADQRANIAKMVHRNLTKFLDIRTVTSDIMHESLKEMLNNPMYLRNVKQLSKRYRDQPQTPLERATFWVEYVLRHGTAEHLVLAARNTPAYQTANTDVLTVILLVLVLVYLLFRLIVTGCQFMFTMKHHQTKKEKLQ